MTKTDSNHPHRLRSIAVAAALVAVMALTAKTLFFKAKEHAEETTHLADVAGSLEQKVVSLETYAEELSARQESLAMVLNFQIENAGTVLFVANRDGVITDLDGSVAKWGYTKTQVIGMKIEQLRPPAERIPYIIRYQARAKEGATAEVHFFENEELLGGDGKRYPVSGGVFWHGERQEFVAFIAPATSGEP